RRVDPLGLGRDAMDKIDRGLADYRHVRSPLFVPAPGGGQARVIAGFAPRAYPQHNEPRHSRMPRDRASAPLRSHTSNGGNMPELRISTEKVCALIEAAREVAGKVPSTAGDRTTTGDDSKLET